MSESKELVLVTLPAAEDLEAAFISDDYINRLIADIRQKASSVVGDVSTVKGRGVYISMASTVRRTKTVIDDAGKSLVAEMKKRPSLVDASRKKVRDALDELAVEIRRPATEWEEAEKARTEALQQRLVDLRALADVIDTAGNYLPSADIQTRILEAKSVVLDESWQERAAEAGVAKDSVIQQLEASLVIAQKREHEAAELDRLRKEAEEKARLEREAKAAAEKAEQEKNAAIAAERRRQEEAESARLAEQKRIAEEEARRAADKEHRRSINRQAIADLIESGLTQEMAEKALIAIASGKVSAVSIKY